MSLTASVKVRREGTNSRVITLPAFWVRSIEGKIGKPLDSLDMEMSEEALFVGTSEGINCFLGF